MLDLQKDNSIKTLFNVLETARNCFKEDGDWLIDGKKYHIDIETCALIFDKTTLQFNTIAEITRFLLVLIESNLSKTKQINLEKIKARVLKDYPQATFKTYWFADYVLVWLTPNSSSRCIATVEEIDRYLNSLSA